MQRILLFFACCLFLLPSRAQQKPAAYYWAQVPAFPSSASQQAFRSFLESVEDLRRTIDEDAQAQEAAVAAKASTATPAIYQNPQNASQAEIQALMKRTQDRVQLMEDLNRRGGQINARFESTDKDYQSELKAKVRSIEEWMTRCPSGQVGARDQALAALCDQKGKELEAARAAMATKWFLSGTAPFKGYLADYAAFLKSSEPRIVKSWQDSFVGTGINIKGTACPESIKQVVLYLNQVHAVFTKALEDGLLKP
ncbi:hypothetical protein [Flaviaesturariibacter amylovorans]|uniref:DUF3826 domain-containing protein n=1 Tax=Flaviaesturariibacter amylovorans TaxID=1084520 RepID=A0ABP8GPH0_9BACT